MNTRIIGISGKMGAGKDTLALIMQYYIAVSVDPKVQEYMDIEDVISGKMSMSNPIVNWKTKRFADKLKECASLILGVPRHKFEDQDFKKKNMPSEWDRDGLPMTYREFLQELGTEGARSIHPQFWVNALFSDLNENQNWIVTDVRFPNEADAIKERGGKVIQIIRSVDRPIGASHASETAMDNYFGFDYTIMNNGTIEELCRQAIGLLLQEGIISNEKSNSNSKKEEETG